MFLRHLRFSLHHFQPSLSFLTQNTTFNRLSTCTISTSHFPFTLFLDPLIFQPINVASFSTNSPQLFLPVFLQSTTPSSQLSCEAVWEASHTFCPNNYLLLHATLSSLGFGFHTLLVFLAHCLLHNLFYGPGTGWLIFVVPRHWCGASPQLPPPLSLHSVCRNSRQSQ